MLNFIDSCLLKKQAYWSRLGQLELQRRTSAFFKRTNLPSKVFLYIMNLLIAKSQKFLDSNKLNNLFFRFHSNKSNKSCIQEKIFL